MSTKNIINVTPGLLPIPPNGWGAVEKIIWEIHQNLLSLGCDASIKYLDDVSVGDGIVHIHVANLANMAHERGIPYYFTMHDHHAYLYGKDSHVYKENLEAIKNAKKAFVPAKYLVEYFENIPEYFSHGVNTDTFTAGVFTEHKLLCVANNGFIHDQSEDRKGFGYAIEAAKKLNLPITIAGPSNNKKYFEAFPPNYDKLTILYDLNEEELIKLYQQHSIFLHPSILEAGHPNLTLLEAMACGLPVVGTFEKDSSINGMVIIKRSVYQIAEAVEDVIKHYTFWRTQALNQAKELSWRNRTQHLLKYYNLNMRDQLIDIYNNTEKLFIQCKKNMPTFNINFIDGAFVEVLGGDSNAKYKISFIDKTTNELIHSDTIGSNCWTKTARKYFTDWKIEIEDGEFLYEYNLELEDVKVYIALDSRSLGDTLAWMPYVEEFRKKHKCKVVCSTFLNNLFQENYPEIEFTNPGEVVHGLKAMYTVGWFYYEDGNIDYNKIPNNFRFQPLQKTATDVLGLSYVEIRPELGLPKRDPKKQVAIAIHGTAQSKYWNNPTGWQELVDYLSDRGYTVKLLSQEEDGFMGNKHPSGIVRHPNGPLEDVIKTLRESDFFIGIGSGLSWLSWACQIPTVIISGFSFPYTETILDTIRVEAPQGKCSGCFNTHRLDAGDWNWCPVHKGTERQFECSKSITAEDVIQKIKPLVG